MLVLKVKLVALESVLIVINICAYLYGSQPIIDNVFMPDSWFLETYESMDFGNACLIISSPLYVRVYTNELYKNEWEFETVYEPV